MPRPPQPEVVRGFESVNRYWDRLHDSWAAKILPGEFYISRGGELISTVLGSCVSVCIRDRLLGIGGMNHFMLPEEGDFSSQTWGSDPDSRMTRYGNWAIEYLINELIKIGADKRRFEAKVFGGGQVIPKMSDIGQRNILFTFDYLQKEGLAMVSSDVGDRYPRKVVYFPETGRVLIKKLKTQHNRTILEREQAYRRKLDNKKPTEGDIELF
ncbi:MAG: chemoreceptor glutamine deamidase CheD [Reinekea sp.]